MSLNAAVEAARAGESGAGFSVVADEVRNLAQKSTEALNFIDTIIKGNLEKSEKGEKVTKLLSESLININNKSVELNQIMDEINTASIEQSQGVSQINNAVSQMEHVTQNIAATAEQSASSSEELNAQSKSLKEIVQELIKLIEGQK